MRFLEVFSTVAAFFVLAMFGVQVCAQPVAARCFTAQGLSAPRSRESTVVVVDASTFLTPAQQGQARELLLAELRPGRSMTIYTFARGPGQETMQRAAHIELPMALDDPWKVAGDRAQQVNSCIQKQLAELQSQAGESIDLVLRGYVRSTQGESPVVQAITYAVANHPRSNRFFFITDGVQHQKGFSLYDTNASPAGQVIRRIDSRADLAALTRIGAPAMNPAMQITMFPIGQVEPASNGQLHHQRLASEVGTLIELWRAFLKGSGAGRISVTTFVPLADE